jgi:hypothetical protein
MSASGSYRITVDPRRCCEDEAACICPLKAADPDSANGGGANILQAKVGSCFAGNLRATPTRGIRLDARLNGDIGFHANQHYYLRCLAIIGVRSPAPTENSVVRCVHE